MCIVFLVVPHLLSSDLCEATPSPCAQAAIFISPLCRFLVLTEAQIPLDTIAGAGAGVVTTVVCCPLDVAKTRVQVQASLGYRKYTGLFDTMRTIWLEEGMRGFYRGLEPSLITIPVFWAVYFSAYEKLHTALQEHDHGTHIYHHCLAAAGSALAADCITNPLWVVRTRMMTDIYHHSEANRQHTLGAIRRLVREEGLRGMYKGLSASLLGITHVVVQFPIYEELKLSIQEQRQGNKLGPADLVFASATSKLIASTVTYPHEVLRSRLQDFRGPESGGLRATFMSVWEREGFRGFYQGLTINLIRVVPACVCTFLTYETIKRFLTDTYGGGLHSPGTPLRTNANLKGGSPPAPEPPPSSPATTVPLVPVVATGSQ
jgi:solute carrier family 25 folate transporter 32